MIARQQHRSGAQQPVQVRGGVRRVYAGLEWTESDWFKVWLQLAREHRKSMTELSQNKNQHL
jgi:hypothetical protein